MRLGEVIRKWRLMSELTIRDVAAMIGISATTMHRFESGDDVDGRTLIAVLKWLLADQKESSTSNTGVAQEKARQTDADS
jgi:transcriptional regulator with XRE-family HTH domain